MYGGEVVMGVEAVWTCTALERQRATMSGPTTRDKKEQNVIIESFLAS